jgi:hypothetical protein
MSKSPPSRQASRQNCRFWLTAFALTAIATSANADTAAAGSILSRRVGTPRVESSASADNEVLLDITADAAHPRNSEGAFASLSGGGLMFCYSEFAGGANDASTARLVEIRSNDQGHSWTHPREIVAADGGLNVMSVSLLRLADDRLALYYVAKRSHADCHPMERFSTDDGMTWSPPVRVVDAPGYFVLNNDRVIQTAAGRLIMPVAFHRNVQRGDRMIDYRAIALWYYSDDAGATWRESATWWAIPVASEIGLQEPGVVELRDGTLFSWARTDQGMQYGLRSTDHGETWSAPQPTTLRSPIAPASIKPLPGSRDLLAVYNDHSGKFPFHTDETRPYSGRSPLVAAISHDGGRTWPARKVLEDELDCDYCYAAIHFEGDSVVLAYSCYDHRPGRPAQLRLRRLARSWLPVPATSRPD